MTPLPRAASAARLAPCLLLLACGTAAVDTSADAPTVRVAVCQIEVDSRPDVNFDRIGAALAEAAAQHADLACFPEACVFGWVNSAAHDGAAPIPGALTDRVAALAARHDVMVALGLAERDGDRLYNCVVLIDRDGTLLLKHRKVNVLRELMEPPYSAGPGAAGSVVDTRLGRIGLLICADTFPEPIVDQLARQSPDLVIVPYGWAAPADDWPDHGRSLTAWVVNTARRCRAPVVGTDSVGRIHDGPWKGFVLGGQSPVCDATGAVIAALPDRASAVRVVDVPLAPRR